MRPKQGFRCGIRLMAQAMALVFALVSVLSGFAHACHGSIHGTALESVAHHASGDGGAVASHQDHAPVSGDTSHESTHPCCADLQCHGGIAIVVAAGAVASMPHTASQSFAISDQTHEDWHLAALDRPPRSFVQV